MTVRLSVNSRQPGLAFINLVQFETILHAGQQHGSALPVFVYMHECVAPQPSQHQGWLRLWEEGEGCRKCNQHLCPLAPDNCSVGQVQDDCGCCEQRANVEGQQCDPWAQKFYGRCGKGLVCQRKMPKRGHRAARTYMCLSGKRPCMWLGWVDVPKCLPDERGHQPP